MKKQERLNEIINLVNKAGTVYVQDIMESMQVSDMTVRRDLIELESKGSLFVFEMEPKVTNSSLHESFPMKRSYSRIFWLSVR